VIRRAILACALLTSACEQPESPPQPTPTPSPPPIPSPTPPPPPADARTLSTDDAISNAERAILEKCGGLVYKQGCRKLRRGKIELAVTLAADGSQTKVETIANTIKEDPALVLGCVTKALAAHRFDAPGATTRLALALVFSDKC
jgi:hypothetical protein